MKRKLFALSERYANALRTHLKAGVRASLRPALAIGHQAVALGLETLQLARMHEGAVAGLGPAHTKRHSMKNAESFFTEALTPIVETHRAARQIRLDLDRLTEALDERTAELAATNRQLQRGIVRRKAVEAALKKSGVHYSKLLKDSLLLQTGLRQLTQQVMAAQEEERKKMIRTLQEEINQTLLSVNTRLLTIKRDTVHSTQGLKNE